MQIADTKNTYYTAAHELMHFLTLDSYAVQSIKNGDSYKALIEIYNFIANKKGRQNEITEATVETYGLKNEEEFLAELLLNPAFRAHVSDIFAKNFYAIKKQNRLLSDKNTDNIVIMLIDLFRDIFDTLFNRSDIDFNQKKSVIDDAVDIATQLFMGGTDIVSGQKSGDGAIVVPVSRSQAALAQPGEMSKFEQKIANVKRQAAQVEAGEKRISRYAEEVERGRTKGGRRNVEASILLGRSYSGPQSVQGIQEQQDLIERYAKIEGIWFGDTIEVDPDKGELVEGLVTYLHRGIESHVYVSEENTGIVRKAMVVINPMDSLRGQNENSVLDFIDRRISIHNAISASAP